MHPKLVWKHPSPGFDNLVTCHLNYTGEDRARFNTDEEFIEWFITERLPATHPFYNPASLPQLVQEEDWPTDHTFIDAWEWSD